MSGLRSISSTLAFVFAFAVAPLFLQHCVMAGTVLPRIFVCEDERPVEPPCHDSEQDAASLEMCCAGVEAALVEEALTLDRTVAPTPAEGETLVASRAMQAVCDASASRLPDAVPPLAAGNRLSVVLCTFLC